MLRLSTETTVRARAATLIEFLVVVAILALLIALTHAGVQRVREAAARTRCSENLRQVCLGLSNYHVTHGKLPSGFSLRESGSEPYPYLSWQARVLPYLDRADLWRQTEEAYRSTPGDFTASPPHPFATPVSHFGCPSDSRALDSGMARGKIKAAFTSYVGVSGTRTIRRGGILYLNSQTRFADIRDGLSNTLMVGERPPSGDLWQGWWYAGFGCDSEGRADMVLGVRDGAGGCVWSLTECPRQPVGFRRGEIENNCDALHYWSLHSGGANFAFADGSVRFLTYSADPIMPALATRAGGERVTVPE